MSETTHLEALICKHAERIAAHANIFTRVAPEAIGAQDALFYTLVKDLEARRKHCEEHERVPFVAMKSSEGDLLGRVEQFRQRLHSQIQSTDTPVIRADGVRAYYRHTR